AAHSELREALDAATKAESPDLGLAKDLHAGVKKMAAELEKRDELEQKERDELAALRTGMFDDDAPKDTDTGDKDGDKGDETPADAPADKKEEEPVAASTGSAIVARLKAFAS